MNTQTYISSIAPKCYKCMPESEALSLSGNSHTLPRRHLERRPVILSAAKDLARRTQRSCAEFTLSAANGLRACPERSEGMTARHRSSPLAGSLLSKCLGKYYKSILWYYALSDLIRGR